MAIDPTELVGALSSQTSHPRVFPHPEGIRGGTLAAIVGAPALPHLTPLSFNDATGFYNVWSAAESGIYTITSNATPATAGTFTLTVLGETTAAIAFDATAAAVQAAIEDLGQVDIGDVVAVQTTGTDLGDASAVVTITFGGNLAGVDVNMTADFSGLTGNPHVLAETTAGGGADTAKIDAFLWSPTGDQATDATDEIVISTFRKGIIHRDDVPIPTGESQGGLDAALKQQHLSYLGIEVQGLAGVH